MDLSALNPIGLTTLQSTTMRNNMAKNNFSGLLQALPTPSAYVLSPSLLNQINNAQVISSPVLASYQAKMAAADSGDQTDSSSTDSNSKAGSNNQDILAVLNPNLASSADVQAEQNANKVKDVDILALIKASAMPEAYAKSATAAKIPETQLPKVDVIQA